MAVKFAHEEKTSRKDYFGVAPGDVIVQESDRRRRRPPTEAEVIEMAMSLLEHGQEQPAIVRKIAGDRLKLVLGFTRMAAVRKIREGFTGPDGEFYQKPEFQLKVIVEDINEQLALVKNIVENIHRKNTGPCDDAVNQRDLRDTCGYTDAAITRLYRYNDPNKVARLRRLLVLPNDIQDMIDDGKLPVSAALDVLDLDTEAKQKEAFAKIREDLATNGKVNGQEVRDMVRQSLLADTQTDEETEALVQQRNGSAESNGKHGENGHGKIKKKPLTMAHMRKFFTRLKEEHADEEGVKFAKSMLNFMSGGCGEQSAWNAVDRLLDAERT